MRSCVLALDVGTGAVKVAVFRPGEGSPVASSEVPCEVPAVPGRPDWAEAPVELWRRAVVSACRAIGEGPRGEVGAIGVTGLFPAVIALDAEGSALHPAILYSDRRSVRQLERLIADGSAELIERIGGSAATTGTTSLTSVLWLRDERPDVLAGARWLGHMTTWAGMWLTGTAGIDSTNASLTGAYDTAAGVWSEEVHEALGLDAARWPPVRRGTDVLGVLRESAARELGLAPGLPVVLAGGDTACAAVGSGCTAEGALFVSSGTTDTLCLVVSRPVFDSRLYCAAHAVPSRWLSMAPTSFTGGCLPWIASILCPGSPRSVAEALELARSAPPGAGGSLFLPYLRGERAPMNDPTARGVFFGLSDLTDRACIARSVLEGAAFAIRSCLDLLAQVHGHVPVAMRVSGGPAMSPFWNEVKASACGMPVETLAYSDAGLLGAAACAAEAAGLVESVSHMTAPFTDDVTVAYPAPGLMEVYERLYPIFLALYHSLAAEGLFRRLGGVGQEPGCNRGFTARAKDVE